MAASGRKFRIWQKLSSCFCKWTLFFRENAITHQKKRENAKIVEGFENILMITLVLRFSVLQANQASEKKNLANHNAEFFQIPGSGQSNYRINMKIKHQNKVRLTDISNILSFNFIQSMTHKKHKLLGSTYFKKLKADVRNIRQIPCSNLSNLEAAKDEAVWRLLSSNFHEILQTDSEVTATFIFVEELALPPPLLNKSGFIVKFGDSEELLFPGDTEAG